ncbi:hypothetical protein TVAG_016920 [Trichomonas vaginalis G3]|uniref:Uncharacterized protein n=1 Tax=Trichomonas vaginalis (strain ATCC PRA-98 / G3) TaxID=412133 RepID=A2ER30_TRIV3|nr:hypothetical protein TVAGG3_0535070 [Trichomonas vaginalis G3]EAY04920.1 hypothetical protein TVAG_016920 [Trichomonas vaginalis G3]KAI5519422.1 hypothetical protein TVAGG3_0535070 [Trichomonas vaginalis G3]|eukprot:XP_001317143.1 hypothetical protein [Trichomonas vaginalis G3]
MSHSNSRGRSSIHDLPPKMAHKSSLPPKVSAKQAQQYYYNPYTNQNSYGSQAGYQPGSQIAYQQDQAYQSFVPKGRSGNNLQNKPQQDKDSMIGSNNKRSTNGSTQYKQNSKETTKENRLF